jgi:arginase
VHDSKGPLSMFTLVYLTRRIEGMTREAFLDHYHRIHRPLALRLPGLLSYAQMPITRDGYLGDRAFPDYDAVSEYTFSSSAAAEAAFGSPEGIALDEDTGLFMDWPTVITLPVTVSARSETNTTLRLIWPQWQGATSENVAALIPELPLATARRGYAVGATVLDAVLPSHPGVTATVPTDFSDDGTESRDGIEAKDVLLRQLGAALEVISQHDPERILTLGGECSVSVAPFSALAARYGDDLAVIWVDSHPDVGTPQSEYHGYHAMAVATLTGHGDRDVQQLLPATVDPTRVALAGLHSWTDDDYPNAAEWGVATFSPAALRTTSAPLLDWLAATGCSRVAIHLDVDTIDSDEAVFGLGAEPGGLRIAEVRRLIDDLRRAADVVGFTVAEYVPRQVIRVQQLLAGLPLI